MEGTFRGENAVNNLFAIIEVPAAPNENKFALNLINGQQFFPVGEGKNRDLVISNAITELKRLTNLLQDLRK